MVEIQALRVGDCVRLISGSPRMAVTAVRADAGAVDVIWWADHLGMQNDTFHADVLVMAHPVVGPDLKELRA